jgi:drug/metabolite transporter (DMT)-like permease
MGTLWGLAAALFIGSSDFLGGWMSRRASPLALTLWINVVALLTLGLVCAVLQPQISTANAIEALAGGLVSAVAINLIYAVFAAGAMSLAAPLVACGTAIVPITTAAVTGDPPTGVQSVGILFALSGVAAITWTRPADSGRVDATPRAFGLILAASFSGGAAFSLLLLSAGGGADSAVGASCLSRVSEVSACAALVLAKGTRPALDRSLFIPTFGAGELEAAGVTLFLVASVVGERSVVAVIVSLYAVVTVLLARAVLRERIAAHQGWGIFAAAVGVALLSAG